MAFTYTYTEWSNGNNFTYTDMNRINENINEMYPAAALPTYTNNDILTTMDWQDMINALQVLLSVSGVGGSLPGSTLTADTINEIESLIQAIYDRINLNNAQEVANIYANDDLYSADIAENYVRGV